MRPVLFVVVMLALSTAAAQPGPAPGHENGLEYAKAYAEDQAANASADPVGYAQGKASVQAVDEEARHTGYMACWIADDAVGAPAACDTFYTPPQEADPRPADEAANETAQAVEDVKDTAKEISNMTEGAVQEILEDPTSAPSVLQRLLEGFIALVSDAVGGVVDGVMAVVQLLADAASLGIRAGSGGLTALTDASLKTLDVTQDLSVALWDANIQAYQTAAGWSVDGAKAIGSGMQVAGSAAGDATKAVGVAIVDAGKAVGDAATDAADAAKKGLAATGDAVADAARSVADGVRDAVDSVAQTVRGWFQTDAPDEAPVAPVDAPVEIEADTSLLEDVLAIAP